MQPNDFKPENSKIRAQVSDKFHHDENHSVSI